MMPAVVKGNRGAITVMSPSLARAADFGYFERAGPQTITRLPETVNLVIYSGDDLAFTLEVTDADGSPADLDGAEVLSQIRANATSSSVSGELEAVIDGNAIQLFLRSNVSGGLPDRGVWDCELTDAEGWVTTLVAGTVAVTRDVTRRP